MWSGFGCVSSTSGEESGVVGGLQMGGGVAGSVGAHVGLHYLDAGRARP